MLAVGVITSLLVACGFVVAWVVRREQRRGRELAALADQRGWQYAKKDPFATTQLPLALLHEGNRRSVRHVLWGPAADGTATRVFGYSYTVDRSGGSSPNQDSSTYTFTCALLDLGSDWPATSITRGHALRVVDLLGISRVHTESEEFDRRFLVCSSDARFASALVDPLLMQHLLDSPGRVRFEIGERWLLAARADQIEAKRVDELLAAAEAFRAHIPKVVWSLYPPLHPPPT